MTDEKRLLFNTWNGRDRPAMYWGVPIFPLIGLSGGALVAFAFGTLIAKWWVGALMALPFLFLVFVFYFVSAQDDRYSRRLVFAMRRLFLSLKYGMGLMLAPQNPKWSQIYGKRFAVKRHVSRSDDPTARVSRP